MPRERHPNRKMSQRKRSQEKDISRERHPNIKISQEKDIPTERYLKERQTDRQILLIRVRREIFHGVVSPRNRPFGLDEKQILAPRSVGETQNARHSSFLGETCHFASTRSKFSLPRHPKDTFPDTSPGTSPDTSSDTQRKRSSKRFQ